MDKKSFLIFCLSFFTVSFGVSAMAALIPSIAQYFGKDQLYTAKLIWLYMVPYGVIALFWSPLTRTVSVRKIFLFTTVGFSLASFLFSFSRTLHQAFFFRLLIGCFGCSFVPLILISIGKTISGKNKGKYIGMLFALSYISTSLSVFLSGFLSWRTIYLIPAVLSFLVFALALFFLEDFDFRKQRFKISYLETFKDKQAVRFFIAVVLASFFYHSLQQLLGVYLSSTYSLQQKAISSIIFVSTLSAMSFEFLGGVFSSRFGAIRVARVGFFLMSGFVFLLVITAQYKLLFLFIALWGSGWALTHVGMSAYLTEFPDKILRDASSLNSALRFSAGGLGAFIGGILVSKLGFKTHFLIVGVCVVFLGLYLNKMFKQERSVQSC